MDAGRKCAECGRTNSCKWRQGPTCNTCYRRGRYRATAEHCRGVARDWRKKNPEKVRQQSRKKYGRDKEKILERNRAYHKRYYQKNKERLKVHQRRWSEKNPERARFAAAKIRKRHGRRVEWELSFAQWLYLKSQPCFYCQTALTQKTGAALDRIDNRIGYVPHNVLPCCPDCNYIRGTRLTVYEAFAAIQAVSRIRVGGDSAYLPSVADIATRVDRIHTRLVELAST